MRKYKKTRQRLRKYKTENYNDDLAQACSLLLFVVAMGDDNQSNRDQYRALRKEMFPDNDFEL